MSSLQCEVQLGKYSCQMAGTRRFVLKIDRGIQAAMPEQKVPVRVGSLPNVDPFYAKVETRQHLGNSGQEVRIITIEVDNGSNIGAPWIRLKAHNVPLNIAQILGDGRKGPHVHPRECRNRRSARRDGREALVALPDAPFPGHVNRPAVAKTLKYTSWPAFWVRQESFASDPRVAIMPVYVENVTAQRCGGALRAKPPCIEVDFDSGRLRPHERIHERKERCIHTVVVVEVRIRCKINNIRQGPQQGGLTGSVGTNEGHDRRQTDIRP